MPYDALLEEICSRLGFCGSVSDEKPLHVDMLLADTGSVTAEQFVDAVLQAEGFEPAEAAISEHRNAIHEAFVRHMGADQVEAHKLK